MTDTEAKALALVNAAAQDRHYPIWPSFERSNGSVHEALCRAIERLESTEARHAAELREQAERFSEAALLVDGDLEARGFAKTGPMRSRLAPFILPAPDPLVEAMVGAWPQYADRMEACNNDAKALCAAIEARGGKIVWEAGE